MTDDCDMSELSIRPASRAELDTLIDWAAAEGWNPGHHDGDAFHATDPGGFLIGWLGDEPVAAVSVVAYDDGFGFLGFYICHPDHRGHRTLAWRENGTIRGYGTIRPCREGHKIGPLFADTPGIAAALCRSHRPAPRHAGHS